MFIHQIINYMKVSVITLSMFLIAGCASIKYPGWEQVTVTTSVDNMPCIEKGNKEECKNSPDDCRDWFKKRATLVDANATVIHSSERRPLSIGRYFYCKNGLNIYKEPKFVKEEYQLGSNTVTGQAFLRQKGGGVVTCAGSPVLMYPDSQYFADIVDYDAISMLDKKAQPLFMGSTCDAQGNFEFHNVPAGKWIIKTIVSWDVPSVNNIGSYYYTVDMPQGGEIIQKVIVSNGVVNKFIMTR